MSQQNNKGFSLVEILLATALLSLFLAAVTAAFVYGLRGVEWAGDRARAVFLAEEGLAAVQNIRDERFINLSDGVFGLSSSGAQWTFNGSSDTTEKFIRQLSISSVDADTKNITSTVTWPKSAVSNGSVSLVTRLTSWLANTASGWSAMVQSGTYDASGSQDGWKVQIAGNYAYLIRSGGSPDFLVINITNPLAPTLEGSVNVGSSATNIAVAGNFAYVTGASNTLELRIVNITTPSAPTIVGSYNAVGTANALGVAVSGNIVYMTRASSADPEFVAINVTNKNAPVTLGSLELGDAGNELALSGSYAYIASSNNTQELQIVNITTPATPTLAGSYDFVASATNATTVTVSGNLIYLGKVNTVFIFRDVTHLTANLLGSLDLAGQVNGLALGAANMIFAATSNITREFQALDVTTPASPALLGYVDLVGVAAYGVAYDAVRDQCALADEDNTAEFIMVTHP
ncbi:MAG: prepilin-type N-terminal cleavage/methylation domain-containing protein [Candidatus Uhrbacteria bacterium]